MEFTGTHLSGEHGQSLGEPMTYDTMMSEITKEPPVKPAVRWTEEKVKFLVDSREMGYSHGRIAEILKMSRSSVRDKLRSLDK